MELRFKVEALDDAAELVKKVRQHEKSCRALLADAIEDAIARGARP